jgi:hypothetical protein
MTVPGISPGMDLTGRSRGYDPGILLQIFLHLSGYLKIENEIPIPGPVLRRRINSYPMDRMNIGGGNRILLSFGS